MLKFIMASALIGWGAILSLAWWLANSRIAICSYADACVLRATATRDHILTNGLTVSLIGAVVLAIAWPAIKAEYKNRLALVRTAPPRPASEPLKMAGRPKLPLVRWGVRSPQARLALTALVGMCLATGLLWWGGMIRPAVLGWQSSPLVNAQVNPYENLIDENMLSESFIEEDAARTPTLVEVEGVILNEPGSESPATEDDTTANAATNDDETSNPQRLSKE